MKFEGDAGKSDGFDCEGERLSMQHCPCCAGEHLGSLEHILHRPHPKSPDPRLLRVANDDREGRWVSSRGVVILVSRLDHARGFMSVGTSGWHVDGVMLQAPKLGAVQRIFQRNVPAGQAFTKVCCQTMHHLCQDSNDLNFTRATDRLLVRPTADSCQLNVEKGMPYLVEIPCFWALTSCWSQWMKNSGLSVNDCGSCLTPGQR